ncbi:hypothetical protein LOZ53_002780 [Ophidiomyces ophidiicola]|nr:hypothetical protein LOZ55_002429 [Ophidiomyces ophidiicola]KAI1983543.1 hypothetical protein LOZ54_004874 [Ophidiomyces ophidiicola]KAI1988100.1 hypothetical protein LOZ51_005581 [Ophidiomyces ophidiicola]KAI1991588.1 hypothetical protein LOZ53_002780 [Ophidiomyces ophidiicola]
MATTEAPSRPHDRHGRRRPFSNWMKRLANLKNSSSSDSHDTSKHNGRAGNTKNKKAARNNPYPLSGTVYSPGAEQLNGRHSTSDLANSLHQSEYSPSESCSRDGEQVGHAVGRRSVAPTLSTNADTVLSDTAYSKTGTSATAGGGRSCRGGGEGSTFSSPAPSVQSLTTTLTTVQSGAPNHYLTGSTPQSTSQGGNQPTVQFSHQFPTTPVSAIPHHISPHPTTYSTATANNLLTDNASVLTLASSSKRRRRNSLDTNASVRALAPSSIFSGSRESLPLSVLSGNMGSFNATGGELSTSMPVALGRSGMLSTERASVYSTSGAGLADRGSIRSGLQSHHGRNDSSTGSIGGITANSYFPNAPGKMSRRSSAWGEIPGSENTEEDDEQDAKVHLNHDEGGGNSDSKAPAKSH